MNQRVQNTESYYEWLRQKEELVNRYFDFNLFGSLAIEVKEMHVRPKVVKDNFLEIGITNHNEKLCMYIGDDDNKGRIFLYGWKGFNEYYEKDIDGNEVEYHQEDIYGFSVIAKSFSEFLEMLYVNG